MRPTRKETRSLFLMWVAFLVPQVLLGLVKSDAALAEASSCQVGAVAEHIDAHARTDEEEENAWEASFKFWDAKAVETSGVQQDLGIGKVPSEVTKGIQKVIDEMHFYLSREILSKPKFLLVRNYCVNYNEMCAYWSFRGQCNKPEFSSFMTSQCPLACRNCATDDLLRSQQLLKYLQVNLTNAYYNITGDDQDINKVDLLRTLKESSNLPASRRTVLVMVMSDLGMDPTLLTKRLDVEDGNWYLDLYNRVMSLVPKALLRLYQPKEGNLGSDKSNVDLRLLSELYSFGEDIEPTTTLMMVGQQYRKRGYILTDMQAFDQFLSRPMQLGISFAVPNDRAVQTIKKHGPILQMGAGSGYWAALLRSSGIDILAYDLSPPHESKSENAFFDVSFTDEILVGSCLDVLKEKSSMAATRTLLMIWPNDPDPVDNTEFCAADDECEGSQSVWDTSCLDAYQAAGGRKIVFVGEREEAISGEEDSGISATRDFQLRLQKDFVLVERVELPRLWLNEDDLSVWVKQFDATS